MRISNRFTLAASVAALALVLAACSQEQSATTEPAPTEEQQAAAPEPTAEEQAATEEPAAESETEQAATEEPAPEPETQEQAAAEPAAEEPAAEAQTTEQAATTEEPAAEPEVQEQAAAEPAETPPAAEEQPATQQAAAEEEPAAAAGGETLKIGTEGAYPPFNNLTADGQLEGFDVDIAKALCEEMKVTCEFVTQDWDGIIPALQAGKFDAIIASMSITEERKQQVDFTDKYYNTPPAIAVPKESDVSDTSPEALAGKSLGVQGSTTHSNYAEAKYAESDIKMYPTADEYKLDIANGRIDAVMDDVIVISEWLETESGACCKILGTITPDVSIHGPGAGIAVRKGETELVERFNAAIKAIRENGKYQEINDKYFSFDAYGS